METWSPWVTDIEINAKISGAMRYLAGASGASFDVCCRRRFALSDGKQAALQPMA